MTQNVNMESGNKYRYLSYFFLFFAAISFIHRDFIDGSTLLIFFYLIYTHRFTNYREEEKKIIKFLINMVVIIAILHFIKILPANLKILQLLAATVLLIFILKANSGKKEQTKIKVDSKRRDVLVEWAISIMSIFAAGYLLVLFLGPYLGENSRFIGVAIMILVVYLYKKYNSKLKNIKSNKGGYE